MFYYQKCASLRKNNIFFPQALSPLNVLFHDLLSLSIISYISYVLAKEKTHIFPPALSPQNVNYFIRLSKICKSMKKTHIFPLALSMFYHLICADLRKENALFPPKLIPQDVHYFMFYYPICASLRKMTHIFSSSIDPSKCPISCFIIHVHYFKFYLLYEYL